MRIAVIVAAFNVAPFLRQTLHSVMDQTHPDWTLVVIDDGSTDATGAIAAGFNDPRIRLIRQPNAGVSAARNAGLRQAGTADAFLFLDGDDWLAPDALARLAATLDNAPWAVAAAGRYARVASIGLPRLSKTPPEGCLLERLLRRNLFANGGHILIRAAAIEAAGIFREDLSYGEDWEYWARLATCGEFVAVRARTPVLFVRERHGSVMLSRAADPAAYRPALETIHRNPVLVSRLGHARLADLHRRAEAEVAWTVGRELIRHGRKRDGLRWLGRSLRTAPSSRRAILLSLSWLRIGAFRPYRAVT